MWNWESVRSDDFAVWLLVYGSVPATFSPLEETQLTVRNPLDGVRVINIGGAWAGRLAAMLLAEQGADVIDLRRPDRPPHPVDPLLDRGKRVVPLNLKSETGQKRALELSRGADVIIENMRPGAADGLGLGYEALAAGNDALVYLSMPGLAPGDINEGVPAWEGIIDATVGVYTDISQSGRVLGGRPLSTPLFPWPPPMAGPTAPWARPWPCCTADGRAGANTWSCPWPMQ